MSKRKVKFAEEASGDLGEPAQRRFKDKHSIDSDEEVDNGDNENRPTKMENVQNFLTEDDIEGQEDETIKSYDDIKITPFNLREEMEEGHFDSQGNYIANKDAEALQDEWLEGIDWSKVKDNETSVAADTEDSEPVAITQFEKLKAKREILELLKPGENILKALRRLGGKKVSPGKKGKSVPKDLTEQDKEALQESKDNLLKLTELADMLLQQGDFEVYDKTFEKLGYEVKSEEAQFEDADGDDDDDELEKAFMGEKADEKMKDSAVSDGEHLDEVMWEYKWENNEEAEVYGPYQNSCMISWKEQGFFKNGVYCRKVGSAGDFYSSRRIDFDLYS
eukprot:gene14122-15599_t